MEDKLTFNGKSWSNGLRDCHLAGRIWYLSAARISYIGFRFVLVLNISQISKK
jgi:formylglycine-generating enzyme required for sulfatase activity